MRNVTKIVKLANLYVQAVSQTLDLLNTNRDLLELKKKVDNFVEENELSEEEAIALVYKIVKMAQDKFNKLVAPLLDMKPINIADNVLNPKPELQYNITDAIVFYLHDLYHEVSLPGSIEKFEKKDKEKSPYSLEELIEEQTVGTAAVGQPYMVAPQFTIYIDNTVDYIVNNELDLTENNQPESLIKELGQKFFKKFKEDIENIKNPKYKIVAEKLFKYLHHANTYDISFINEYGTLSSTWLCKLWKGRLKDKIAEFTNKNFSMKESENTPYIDKPIMNLFDDKKASLLRRWLLAVDKETDNILAENRQLSFKF